MIEVLIIIGISIFAATSSLISAGKIIDKRRKGLLKITFRGWAMICLNLGIVVFSIIQFSKNKRELLIKDNEAASKQHQRDSILKVNYDYSLYTMKLKYDTSNIKTISTVTEILGKYGFMLDSSNRRLIKIIKDSSKTKVILPNDPVLSLCYSQGITFYEHKDNRYCYLLRICSNDASSTGFDMTTIGVLADSSNNLIYLGSLPLLSKDMQIPKDGMNGSYFTFPDSLKFKFLYLLIKGKYTNLDGSKTFHISELDYYNFLDHSTGIMIGDTKSVIISFMKRNIDL